MKKTISICMFFLTVSVHAQTDFFQFIENIKWKSTESDIVKDYASDIKARKHFYNNTDKSVTNWELNNIILGNYTFKVSFNVDSASKVLNSLSFSYSETITKKEKELAKQLTKELDAVLSAKLGSPDSKEDKEASTMDDYTRTWYKDTFILDVTHMIFSDLNFYSITVKESKIGEPDFRVARWGDSKELIKSKEGKPDKAGIDKIYLFEDYIAGMDCDVAYIFTDNKLSMAKYLFNTEHTNKNDYIEDYKKLVSIVSDKYGKPSYNAPEWKNSLYKDDIEEYGFAVSLGHLSYSAGWSNDKTRITVALYGENYKTTLLVQYVSKKYENLKDDADRKQSINKF